VFESVAGQRLIVANPTLKPEDSHNVELGARWQQGSSWLQGFVYYTALRNYIVTDRFTYNGNDSVLYDGTLTPVYASQNKASAYLYGAGVQGSHAFNQYLSVNGNTQYTYGRIKESTGVTPLDHIPPVTGRFGIRYANNNLYTVFFTLFNGNKPLAQYNLA